MTEAGVARSGAEAGRRRESARYPRLGRNGAEGARFPGLPVRSAQALAAGQASAGRGKGAARSGDWRRHRGLVSWWWKWRTGRSGKVRGAAERSNDGCSAGGVNGRAGCAAGAARSKGFAFNSATRCGASGKAGADERRPLAPGAAAQAAHRLRSRYRQHIGQGSGFGKLDRRSGHGDHLRRPIVVLLPGHDALD